MTKYTNNIYRNHVLHKHPITIIEVLQFIGMRFSFLVNKKKQLESYFKESRKIWWLSENRFMYMNHTLMGCVDTLGKQLSESFSKVVTNSQIVAIDESLFKYFGKSPCIRYISRKPHKLGHLAYCVTTKSLIFKFPFVIGILPMTPAMKGTPLKSIVENLVFRGEYEIPIRHIVVDALFTSKETIEELALKDVFVTGSVRSTIDKEA